jgi:hypothetical protein
MEIIEANHDIFFKDLDNPWSIWWETEVKRIDQLLEKAKIMDLWFGVWRHIKQLLELWHNVDGVELSEIWYSRLKQDLKNTRPLVNLSNIDMFEYEFTKQYDCIFSNMSLQYAHSEEQFRKMISKMKKNTRKGWINYIKLPAHGMTLWFPFKILDLDALKNYYSDWEILFDKFETQKKEGSKIWIYVTIIARKKS